MIASVFQTEHLHFSPSSVFLYNIELIKLVVFHLNSQWYTITAAAVIFKRNTLLEQVLHIHDMLEQVLHIHDMLERVLHIHDNNKFTHNIYM